MRWIDRLALRLRSLFRRTRVERELDNELQFHLEQEVAENVAAGMSVAQARSTAMRSLGNVAHCKEECRDSLGLSLVDELRQDVKYALRQCRKNPGFTLVAIVTLALGIGANSAVFSVVNAVMIRPLPYPESRKLMTLWVEDTQGAMVGSGWIGSRVGDRLVPFGAAYLDDLRARIKSFESLDGLSPTWPMTLTRAGEPGPIQTAFVSNGLAKLLAIRLVGGREFTAAEHQPGAARVAIISAQLWNRLGGQGLPDQERVTLDGIDHAVVGVAEDLPLPGMPVDALIPFVHNPFFARRFVPVMFVLGRLRPNVTIDAARAELAAVSEGLARDYPETSAGRRLVIVPLQERMVGRSRTLLSVLLSAVGLLVLVGCANVANLLLVRASARRREIAMRLALGAGRLRIVRQLVTESVLLALAGAAAGLLLARWTMGLLTGLLADDLPPGTSVAIDMPVLLFTSVVAIATGVIFGLAPALQASGSTLSETFRHVSGIGTKGGRTRSALVIVEVALALVLLAGAGLLMRSFWNLTSVDPGFRTDHIIQAGLSVPDARYPRPADKRLFFERLLARIAEFPGVESAGLVNRLPLGGEPNNAVSVTVESAPTPSGTQPTADRRIASPDYFRTMDVPLISGRSFSSADTPDSTPTAIVNRTMARTFWPDGNPIGRRVSIGPASGSGSGPWLTIVGVVGDVRHHGLDQEPHPELWVPAAQAAVQGMVLVVRTRVEPASVINGIRTAMAALDPEMPILISSLDQVVATSVRGPRSRALLLGGFAALAFLLAAVGIYGVVSYKVSQTTREIGIRMALGAQRADVMGSVLSQSLALTAIGIGLGLAGAVGVTRYLEGMLFNLTPLDPTTFVGVTSAFAAVATLASYIPARRATKVDPLVALRCE